MERDWHPHPRIRADLSDHSARCRGTTSFEQRTPFLPLSLDRTVRDDAGAGLASATARARPRHTSSGRNASSRLAARLVSLYGLPADTTGQAWQYETVDGLYVMQIDFLAGVVRRVYLGHFYD